MSNSQRTTRLTRLELGDEGLSGGGGTEPAPLGFSDITTSAPAGSFVPDGFLSVTSHSASSMVIAIRSGSTIYTFTNATAESV